MHAPRIEIRARFLMGRAKRGRAIRSLYGLVNIAERWIVKKKWREIPTRLRSFQPRSLRATNRWKRKRNDKKSEECLNRKKTYWKCPRTDWGWVKTINYVKEGRVSLKNYVCHFLHVSFLVFTTALKSRVCFQWQRCGRKFGVIWFQKTMLVLRTERL